MGRFGVENLNAIAEEILAGTGLLTPQRGWYAGRPLTITQNNYNLGLFNGDSGIILPDRESDGELRAFFLSAEGNLRRFLPSRLPQHETAFAMTVAQKSGLGVRASPRHSAREGEPAPNAGVALHRDHARSAASGDLVFRSRLTSDDRAAESAASPACAMRSMHPHNRRKSGAGNRVRTDDLLITNQLLYQLSYAGVARRNIAGNHIGKRTFSSRPAHLPSSKSECLASPPAPVITAR